MTAKCDDNNIFTTWSLFPFLRSPSRGSGVTLKKTRHPYWLKHQFSKVLNPLPPLNSLVRRLAGVSDDQSLPCSIMMKNVGENVCCLLFPRRMRTENSEKVSRKQQTFSPSSLWSQKDCSSLLKIQQRNIKSVQTNKNINIIFIAKDNLHETVHY